jgi:D-3-phosphoglycerate dehydrogenase
MKILANDGISNDAKKQLEDNGFTVITEKVNQEDLINKINEENYEGILVRSATKVRKDIIDACPNIKFVGRGGVGVDNIDVEYAREKGVFVFNTPASSSQSVAELVVGNMFATSRFIGNSSRNIENGDFNKLKKEYGSGVELRGKTLGIIGFGRIGQTLASYAIGIGMRVLAVDVEERSETVYLKLPWTTSDGQNVENQVGIIIKTTTNIDELLTKCDYISLHIPKQSNGESVIGKRELELMKDNAIIINTSRGGVINEDDLIWALDNGKIAGAALDVYENEPNPKKELLSHPKILCTPHIGAATNEAQDRIGQEIVDIIFEKFSLVSE